MPDIKINTDSFSENGTEKNWKHDRLRYKGKRCSSWGFGVE